MTKPDWIAKQKPGEKSPDHGKKDHGHGPHEHGMGALKNLDEHGPKQKDDDTSIEAPDEGEEPAAALVAGVEPIAGVTFPSSFYVPNPPPVTDQGLTPRCVAHSSGYDTNQQDRPELGRFNNLDEALFFTQIGGTVNGAYMTAALARRKSYGYPEAINVPAAGGYPAQDGNRDYAQHKIAGWRQIPLAVSAIKAALQKGHGVLIIGTWYHSWFHPFASGKLPAPDYSVGGHARWIRGWNDSYGWRERNSWGTDFGLAGDFYEPYAFLSHAYAAYQTDDA